MKTAKIPRHLMHDVKMKNGRKLNKGDVFYLMGSGTKVEITGKEDCLYPECRVIETGKTSKYAIGQIARIYSKILYPAKKFSKRHYYYRNAKK